MGWGDGRSGCGGGSPSGTSADVAVKRLRGEVDAGVAASSEASARAASPPLAPAVLRAPTAAGTALSVGHVVKRHQQNQQNAERRLLKRSSRQQQ